jgi:hypothetical protein
MIQQPLIVQTKEEPAPSSEAIGVSICSRRELVARLNGLRFRLARYSLSSFFDLFQYRFLMYRFRDDPIRSS